MSTRPEASQADIVLASMPFAPLVSPSLGLSLLKSLVGERYRTEIRYFGLTYAETFGVKLFNWISSGKPSTLAMLGEWIFSPAVLEDAERDDEAYFDLLCTLHEAPLPEKTWRTLLELRSKASSFVDECAEEILSQGPKLVGMTSVFQQHLASLALAKRLKEKEPSLAVVMGGANCEGPMGRELVRQFDFVDAVVSGEGEKVFPELVDRIFAGESLDGMPGVYRPGYEGEPVNAPRLASMDEVPVPDYDDFFAQWQSSPVRKHAKGSLLFETSRGCWWGEKSHCTFCGLNGSGMAFRSKSPERAMEELLTLTRDRKDFTVQVVDNILDMRYFKTFLPALAESTEKKANLFYEVKANLRKEQIRLLKAAGVTGIQPGIESLSDDVLDRMGKGVSVLQNLQLLKWCEEIGVLPMWNLLYGFPGERPEDYEAVAEMMPALVHFEPPSGCFQIRLDRFSPNFERGEELGFRNITPAPSYFHVYPGLPTESVAEMAYYFVYDYEDERSPATYVEPMRQALEAWKKAHAGSSLSAVSDGDRLVIWDGRPMAKVGMKVLDGVSMALFEACDGAIGAAKLAKLASQLTGKTWSEESVEDFLAPLVEAAYLVRHGDKYLSLAVTKNMMPQRAAKAA